jgi:ubiquinone/menaquinone biosynthesis C-methylase UbiE
MSAATNLLKRFLRFPADALIASSKRLPYAISDVIMSDPRLPGKFYPYKADQIFYALLKSCSQSRAQEGLPIPPQRLWWSYGTTTEEFLNSGRADVCKMNELLDSSGFHMQDGNRVLDFGCASGRMIRWLSEFAEQCEVWGVDISAEYIIWCQQHLSPPFKFATVTTAPHLPFEDGYFNLIYCGSVFTHIDDLADAWLLELRRIVSPGGRLYITVQDKNSLQFIINQPEDWWFRRLLRSYDKAEMISRLNFSMFTIGRGNTSQVFYDIDYLQHHWGCILNVLSVTPEAYGYQTAIVLEK